MNYAKYMHRHGHILLVDNRTQDDPDSVVLGKDKSLRVVSQPEDWDKEESDKTWMCHIIPLMSRLEGGQRMMDHELHMALEAKLDRRDLETFYRFLQNVEQEMTRIKKSVKLFPGGPSIHL